MHDDLGNVVSDKWAVHGHELLRPSRRNQLAGDDLFNVVVVYDVARRSLNTVNLESPRFGYRQ